MSLLWVILLASGALAAPRLARREPECRGPNRFSNRVFTYNYEGETVSGIVGSSSGRSALRIRARVVVKPVGECQHSLKVDSTELWESQSQSKTFGYTKSDKSSAFAVELEAHDLTFKTVRGVITDLLPHSEEPTHILNIKRGILSTLQAKIIRDNSTENEVDVSGECSVNYTVHARYINRLPKVISKSKDLAACTEHAKTNMGIYAQPYNEKSISLLKSTSNCRYAVTAKNLIRHVVCKETHLFRPFSAGYNASSGAITTIKQVMKLLNVARNLEESPISDAEAEHKTLKYEHVDQRSTELDIEDVESTIIRLARDSILMTRPESARLFSQLVKSIRKLNVKAMVLVWNKIFECDKEGTCTKDELYKFQSYLLDALPHCGTEGCAVVMSYAIKHELVNTERSNMFLAGIALVSVPTEKVISDLLMLVQTNPSRTGMLTLGTLMHKFCENNPRECQEKKTIVSLAEDWLQDRLGERCDSKTADEAEEILLTLKAIGNAGRPVSSEAILVQCALNGNAPINVSIAALEATRRMPCSEELTEQILSIYAEHNVDVEIRLAAYLALMNCPNPELFKRIAGIQKKEVNNQVGSFVWSHLTNAMQSTEPVHGVPMADMITEALRGSELREFNLNRLRFSRAWEGSFYSDILRAGGSAQGHLIYHPNSYFPRSARLNLTADILGASINVLETAARFEGFEILVEQLFGNDGYFPDDRIMRMFDLKAPEERDDEEQQVNVRGRRSLSDDINKVEKHLKKLHRKMDKYQHHPSGAISVKVFGNEMRLISFDDINWLQSEADNINMVDMLIKLARGGKKSFTKSFMFLDADTTVPTILGLPLKLHAEGTTVASLELAGKFDIRNMFWGPMSFDVRGYIKPSAVVEITARMGVDAWFAEAGILVNASLYTSTEIKGNATYKQKETFRFEIAASEAPIQIVKISSSLYTTLNGKEMAIDGDRRVEPTPCFNMTRVLGISACGQLSLPLAFRDYESPFFPLSGPASFSMSIERTDPNLRMYQILATRQPTEDENEYDIVVKMSTPNATWEREFETNVSLLMKEKEKVFSASMGALGYKIGKIDGRYNNVSNDANLTFSTRDIVYGYPIVVSGQYFNNSDPEKVERELGMKWFVTYKNYTVRQLTKVYNRSQVYGYVSNTSYWRGKYLYSTGEVSIPKKSVAFVANHTCTKTSIRFDGSLGEKANKFIFNFTNKPTNVSIKVSGNYTQREAMLNMFVKPCRQSFTLRGSFAKAGIEKGVHFRASHDNKKRVFTWYTGIVNATQETSIKANASLLGRPVQAVWTYFNLISEKGIRLNASAVDKSVEAVWSYVDFGQEKGLKFNGSALNQTVNAVWTFVNMNNEKVLKFKGSVVNKTIDAAWSFLSMRNEKALKFNASTLNRTLQATWAFQDKDNQKGLTFNATALNKTVQAEWTFTNLANGKSLAFNATALNKSVQAELAFRNLVTEKILTFNATALNKLRAQAAWTFTNFDNEKILRFNARALNKTCQATWSVLNLAKERSLKFNASIMNKTVQATWSYVNLGRERSLSFNAGALNKTISAAWTLLNFANEKSLKFNASVANSTMETAWTWVGSTDQKSLKFNASACNKTVEAVWSFTNLANEKSVRFNARALNETIKAAWTFVNFTNEKSLRFNATAFNRTVQAAWTFVNVANEKSFKFNASALNKTIVAAWTFANSTHEKGIRFKATAFNRTVESAWTYVNQANEKTLKFNASALNKSVEAAWNFVNFNNEKSLNFKARVLNQAITAGWTFMSLTNEKSVKFNATAFNKTIETAWAFVNLLNAKAIKFNATGLNNTVVAMWSYLKGDQEKMIKFNVSTSNKTVEVAWTFLNFSTEKGLRMNATIMRKSYDASIKYFRTSKDMGIRLNLNAYNKSIEMMSKMLVEQKERKMVTSVTYQNYTFAMVGMFQNLATRKNFCTHLKALGKTYGSACVSLTNSSLERSLSVNVSAMNRSAEMKTEWFKRKTTCAIRFSTKANKTMVFESWLSLTNTPELKSLRLNATVVNKSVDATWFFQNRSENAIGINITALGRHVGIKGLWFNTDVLKLASVHLVRNKTLVAFSSVTFLDTANSKRLEFRSMVGRYVAEIQNEYRLHADGRRDLLTVRILRNGSRPLFFDSSRLSYTKTERRRELLFNYNLKVLKQSYRYGWDISHDDYSTSDEFQNTLMFGLLYSKNKRISLTNTIKNNAEVLSDDLVVEYLPGKVMEHKFIWDKTGRLIDVIVELLPKVPLTYRLHWNTDNGFSISSVLSAFRKEISNSFRFDKETESFQGHVEICPVYPLDFSGTFSMSNGLLFTSSITTFKRTWNHRIEINKEERKVLISIEPIPQSPMVFQAIWESAEGMKISADVRAFKKSLHWQGMYEKLTKTLTSDLTILNQKISLLQGLDVDTKTVTLKLTALKRTFGFIGRLDWNAYVASVCMTYGDKRAGWFLKFNPSSRNIIFNITLTPTISAQVAGEMPSDTRLQVTLQRKFSMDIVNESRLVYYLKPKTSRVFLTWNTTTTTNLVKSMKSLKTTVVNTTMIYFNRTVQRFVNLTMDLDVLVKKMAMEIKPRALQIYKRMRTYNYKSLLQNTSQIALNATLRMINLTVVAFNRTVRNLPALIRNSTDRLKNVSKVISSLHNNVTKLYIQLYKNATIFYRKLRTEVIIPLVGNLSLHINNITQDLKAWSRNVTFMLTNITVRGEKVGLTLKRIAMKVERVTKELIRNITIKATILAKNTSVQVKTLIKNITIQAKALMIQIREAEIREQKLGPLFDKYMVQVRNFTCNFSASCTLKNLTTVAMNVSSRMPGMTVLNKTINQHIVVLRQQVVVLRRQVVMLRKQAASLARNLVKLAQNLPTALPKFLRNVSIQTIYLARNVTRDIKNVTFRVRNVTVEAYLAVKNLSDPLVKHLVKVFTSLYYRTKPSALQAVAPVVEFTFAVKGNILIFMRPVVKPLVPLAYSSIYQVRNITVRRVPIGVALDKATSRSMEAVVELLKLLNHTITSNVSAAIDFLKETSQKTPEEIVDITVKTCERFCNFTKRILNQTVQLSYNMSKLAAMSFNDSIQTLNRTLQKVLKMVPDRIVEVSIQKVQVIAANLTSEVLNITKQLRSLDVVKLVKRSWNEMELKKKIDSLELEAKWTQLVERVKAVDMKQQVLTFRNCLANLTVKALNYTQKIANLSYRALNLTLRLGRMDITKEEFTRELFSIGKEVKRIMKEASMVGNTSFLSYELFWNKSIAVYRMSQQYKNLTLNKTLDALEIAKRFSLALYNEHEEDTLKVLTTYKKIALDVYENLKIKLKKRADALRMEVDALKVKVTEKVDALKLMLTKEVHTLVKQLRQYENMTNEEIIMKVYGLVKKYGLVLYNNVTLRTMTFYNETRNMTLEVYNRTMLWVNRTTVMALEYYNYTLNRSMKYYKIGRNISLAYYKIARNYSIQYYRLGRNVSMNYYALGRNVSLRYYSLVRNYSIMYYNRGRNLGVEYFRRAKNLTLFAYNVTRNFTLRTYNMTLNRSLEVLCYVNKTLVPRVRECIVKGKFVLEKAFNKSTALATYIAKEVEEWYEKNKEKTVEELYREVYTLAKDEIDAVVIKVKDRVVKVLDDVQHLNKTVTLRAMNIAEQMVSIFNQTANITAVAGRQLAAIFLPCAQVVQNKSIAYMLLVKNVYLPLIAKTGNTTLKILNQSRVIAQVMYKKFMASRDVQELMATFKVEERFEMAVDKVRQLYKKMEDFIRETRPKVEAKLNEAISYLKVNLPKIVSAKREEFMEKRDEIMTMVQKSTANPTVYALRMYKNALEEVMSMIKDTPIEMIIMHEVWGQFAEEIKQHELFNIGGEIIDYSKLTADRAVQDLRLRLETVQERVSELKEKVKDLKERAQLKAEEIRVKVEENIEGVKKMKLRELVEHSYVFKTIAMVRNMTEKARNVTLEARNATMKWFAAGKVYARNITKNLTVQLQKLNATFQELKRNVTLKFLELKKNFTLKFLELKNNVTLKFQVIKKNVTLKYLEIKTNVTLKYLEIKKIVARKFTEIKKNVTLKYLAIKKYATLKYLELKGNATLKFLELKKNVSLKLEELKKNFTLQIKKYTPILQNYTNIARNTTIKFSKMVYNWTVTQVGASKLWLNKTFQKGRNYYQETVVPYYKTELLPYYQGKLVPMYRNYSTMVVEFSKNMTMRVLVMKEQAMKTALESKPYLMLRRFGKMVIRESAITARNLSVQAYAKALNYTLKAFNFTLEMYNNYTLMVRNFTLEAYNVSLQVYNQTLEAYNNFPRNAYNLTQEAYRNLTLNAYKYTRSAYNYTIDAYVYTLNAYNYTLNMTRRAINITKVKYLAAKTYLVTMRRQSLQRAAPYLLLLNSTKIEIMETVVFVNKYYGFERNLRAKYADIQEELKVKYAVMERRLRERIEQHAPLVVNVTSRFLQYVNRTVVMRLVNQTIVYLNHTGMDLVNKSIRYLNRTSLDLVNSTMRYLNQSGVIKLVNKTIRYLNRTSLGFVNSTMRYLNQSGVFRLVNKTIRYLNRTGLDVVNHSVRYLNRTGVPKAVYQTIRYLNHTGMKLVNLTINFLNRTGLSLVNKTMGYLNRSSVLSFVNYTLRYVTRTGVRGLINNTMACVNKTIRYLNQTGLILLNKTIGYINSTGVLSIVNNTMTMLNRTGVRGLINHTIVYLNKTIRYLNRTSALQCVNIPIGFLNRTFGIFVNKTVVYLNRTGVLNMVNKTMVYLKQAVVYLNRTSALDLVNNTIRYLNRTRVLNMNLVNYTIGYLNRTGLIFVNKTVVYLNRTGALDMVNKTMVYLKQAIVYLNRTNALDMVNDTIRYLNRTVVSNINLVNNTIGYLNRTYLVFIKKTVLYLNSTIGHLNRTYAQDLLNQTTRYLNRTIHFLNSTMLKVRMDLPKYIRVRDGVVSIVIPHLTPIRANIKFVSIEAQEVVQKVRNLARLALNMSRKAVNASKVYLEMTRNRSRLFSLQVRNFTMAVFNMTKSMTMGIYNLTKDIPMKAAYHLTKNMTRKVYKLAKNMTTRIYILSKDMAKAYNLTRNMTTNVYNLARNMTVRISKLCKDMAMMEAYNRTKNMTLKVYNLARNMTLRIYKLTKDMTMMEAYNRTRSITMKVYNIAKNMTVRISKLSKDMTMMEAYNRTRNMTIEVYNLARNMTLRIYKLTKDMTMMEAYNRTSNITMKVYNIAKNMTVRIYKLTKDITTMEAYNLTRNITMKVYNIAKNTTMRIYKLCKDITMMEACNRTRNLTMKVYNLAKNMTMRIYMLSKDMTMMEAYNRTRNMTMEVYNLATNMTTRIYMLSKNMAVTKAYNLTRNMTMEVYNLVQNMTTRIYMLSKNMAVTKAYNLTRNMTMEVYNLVQNMTTRIYMLSKDMTMMEAYNRTRNITLKVYTLARNMTMRIYKLTKDMAMMEAYNRTRNITIKVYNIAKNTTMRIYKLCKDITTMEACNRTRNLTMKVYNLAKNMTMRVYMLSKDMTMMEAYNRTRNMTMEVYNLAKNMTTRIYMLSKNMAVTKAYNLTRNMTMKAYNIAKNMTMRIYKLSKDNITTMKAYNLTRNVTMKVYNIAKNMTVRIYKLCKDVTTMEAYNRTRNMTMKVYNLAKNMTMRMYKICKDMSMMKAYNMSRNMTMEVYNIAKLRIYRLSKDMTMTTAYNMTKNVTTKVYSFAKNMTVRIYKLSKDMPMMKVYNLTRNMTTKMYNFAKLRIYKLSKDITMTKVYNQTKNFTMKVYNLTKSMTTRIYNLSKDITMKVFHLTYNVTMKTYNQTFNMVIKVYNVTYNRTMNVYNQTYIVAMKVYNQTYNTTLKVYNLGYNMTMKVYNRSYNLTKKMYNMTMTMYNRTYHMAMQAFNRTQTMTMKALVTCRNYPVTRRLYNQTLDFLRLSRKFVKDFNLTAVLSLTKDYLPVAVEISREWCVVGFNSTRNFTVRVASIAWYVSRDIYNSSSLKEALTKAKILSTRAYNEIVTLYREVYYVTLREYQTLYGRSMELYRRISSHESILTYLKNARAYIVHSKNIMKMRMRYLRYLRRHLSMRIAHKVDRISTVINPVNWIPPFNSTAMIFGPNHVYTFDGRSYNFPGYKKPDCTYVLARDVRDDNIKLLSQEKALILVMEDINVKVHQDGRVETMTKITVSGKKIHEGYHTELPVQSANTTVVRDGSFVVIQNTIGLEIICDMEHDMCSFDIARWYHGRMTGLLGTNNNEIHDEWMTSEGKPAKSLIDFVNSWQVTKDPECRITENDVIKPTCPPSRYHTRCGEIFKDTASPLAPFFNVADPRPFLSACEYDFTQCKTNTPKDMRHCNATAAYIDLLRTKGEWVEYLPECGRCAQHDIGTRWFQSANKMVDVVLIVTETRSMRNFAQRLPDFVTSMKNDLSKYSFRFGVVGFGGENIHARPHMATVNGLPFGRAEDIKNTIEHLKFPNEPIENNTIDNIEAIHVASKFPFRAGASKIFVLLTGWDRGTTDEARLNRTIRMLKAEAITLNVLGKYKRLQGQKYGQDYNGRMYYKKGSGNIAPLPAGELVKIMKNTEGSVFGASFLATVDKKTFRIATALNAHVWKDEIKRDQLRCRECFCAKGDAGQGRSICRIDTLNKC